MRVVDCGHLFQFGFIAHTAEGANDNKQLFFHQSEVADYVRLKPGDEVEYEVVKNLKTNKSSATNVKRIRYHKRQQVVTDRSN